MRRGAGLALAVGVASLLVTPAAVFAQSAAVERALVQVVERWAIARNANDAEAMRPLFDPQVDLVRATTGDVIASDRDGVVRWFDTGFKADGKGSTVRVGATRVRELSADSGVVDYVFTLQSATGAVTTSGHATLVCIRRGDDWKVMAIRFASAPPATKAAGIPGQP